MSDNPGNEAPELISLGVDVDVSSFNPLNNALNDLKTPLQAIGSYANELNQAFERGEITSTAWAQSMREAADAVNASDQQLKQSYDDATRLNGQIAELSTNYKEMGQAATQSAEATPGTAAADAGSEGGGAKGGSQFGIAHALSVAGMTLNIPGLREAGAFVYIEQGLARALPLMDQFNETLEKSGGLVPPLTSALEAVGIPMSGLVATLLPLAAVVAGVALAIKAYNDTIAGSAALLNGLLNNQKAYFDFIQTATTEDALNKQKDLENSSKSLQQQRDENAEIVRRYTGNENMTGKEAVDYQKQGVQALIPKEIQEAIKRYDELNQKIIDNDTFVGRLIGDLQSGTFATNDYSKAIHDAVEASKAQAEEEAKIADLRESGTAKQVQAEMDRIKHQVEANQAQLDILSKLDQTNPDVIAAEEKIIDDNAELSKSYGELSGDVLELAKARDAEAAAIKEQLAQMKKVEKAEADYNQAREKAITDLANQDAAAKQHEATAERQYTQGSLEDTEARRQIALKESREEVKLKEDTANRITDIGAKLGEKQYTDILNLSRQLYDDQIKYQDGIAKYEREAQDQAVDDQKEHLARLADLNKKDTADETEALLDRNFKKLYTDGLHRQESADKEANSYREREDKLADHLRRQERELGISTQQEEAKQKLALQRKLEDDQRAASAEVVQAVINANRKLQVLEQLEHQQLTDLTAMENYKIRLLHQGLTDEMKLYAQQEQAKLALLAHTRDLILAQNPLGMLPQGASRTGSDLTAQPYHSGPSSRTATAIFDSGGSFGGGDMWSKGSLAEDVRFASGRGYNLGGSAIVYPLESGTVKPGGGKNIQFSPTLNINVPPGQQIDGKKLMNELWGEFQSLIGTP